MEAGRAAQADQGTLFKHTQCVMDEVGTANATKIAKAAPKTFAVAELEGRTKELNASA